MRHENPQPAAPNASRFTAGDWIAIAGVVSALLALTFYTWARWGDVQIDTGHELYTPSALSNGKLLYRDVWYNYGPLSPYILAALFSLFGVHWNVLYLLGLSLTLAIALLLFRTARRFLPALAAFLVSFAFLLQGFVPGLFNYVVPYSYAASIGSLLGIACLYFLVRHTLGEAGPNLLLAGLAAGLALLCKQEFGLACYLVLGFALLLESFVHRSFRPFARGFSLCLPGVLLNILIYGWFIWQLSARFIFIENFQFSPNTPFMRDFGAQWIADRGLRFIPEELLRTSYSALLSVVVWFLLAWAFRFAFRYRWIWICLAITISGAVLGHLVGFRPFGGVWAVRHDTVFPDDSVFPVGMFWVACALFIGRLVGILRGKTDTTLLAQLVVAAYGLALGIRIMVDVSHFGYAIYYNSILFLVFIIVLTEVIGKVLEVLPKRQQTLLITVLLSLEGIGLGYLMLPYTDLNTASLVTRLGTVYTRRTEANLFPQIINFMQEQKALGKRVLVLPEEVFLYVASETEAPTRWWSSIPGVLDIPQESEYIARLEACGVDYILLSNRSTVEYRAPFWGLDFNKQIYRWIQEHYEVRREFGSFRRDGTQPFAMLLYERRVRTTESIQSLGEGHDANQDRNPAIKQLRTDERKKR